MCSVLMMCDSILAAGGIAGLWGSVWPYLLMLFGFSVIVFVHELGHFAVAKWAGVRVDRFAIGFGREVVGFTRGETRYSFNILPLGGYVKMLGQEDFEDKSEELKFKDDPGSFVNKPVGHRMAIVSAGVVMNVIFACLVFMICFMIGLEGVDTRIGLVSPGSPADKAGLLPGDHIKAVNGKSVREFNEVQMAILLAGKHAKLDMTVERDGKEQTIAVEPEQNDEKQTFVLGIAPGATRTIMAVGPELENRGKDYPRVGDVLVEMDGTPITDENIDRIHRLLGSRRGEVVVERSDPEHPSAPAQRVTVKMPPLLQLHAADQANADSIHLLGLTPLARVSQIGDKSRAGLAGIKAGDTVRMFDDIRFPTRVEIERAVRDNAERDVAFEVVKPDGMELRGFVRPKASKNLGGTIQCSFRSVPGAAAGEARAVVDTVRPGGIADKAGLKPGDLIIECEGLRNPSADAAARTITRAAERRIAIKVQRGTETIAVAARPQVAGNVQAAFQLVATDVMQVGRVAETMGGRPSPAAAAGIPSGAKIISADDQPVSDWCALIDILAAKAGTTIPVKYLGPDGAEKSAGLAVPHDLRTKLGIGAAGVIVSIDGRENVRVKLADGEETLSAGFQLAMAEAIKGLVGQKQVPIVYRETPLGEMKTAHIDVTEDMVDQWLSRVHLSPNVFVGSATTLIKGDGLIDSIGIGVHKTHYFILQVYTMIDRMIFSRTVGVENMSGPLGIVAMGGQVAKTSTPKFLFFLGMLSANLAVINFLPLPIVDGGLMVFLLIEKIKGSPVSIRVQVATQMLGLVLIIGTFLFVTFNDAMRLFG